MPAAHGLSTARQVYEWACLLGDLALAAYLVICLVRRERAGRVLFDLGRLAEDRSTQWLVMGAFQLLLGSLGVLTAGARDYRWGFFAFVALQGVNSIVMGLRHFLICEAGVVSSDRLSQLKLYRWDDILCYDIEQGKLRLKLRAKGASAKDGIAERWVTCRGRVRLDYTEELDALLASRCPRLRLPIEV